MFRIRPYFWNFSCHLSLHLILLDYTKTDYQKKRFSLNLWLTVILSFIIHSKQQAIHILKPRIFPKDLDIIFLAMINSSHLY